MTDIKLNFINQSNDANNSQIVIFQKNVATSFNEIAIAWKVIKNAGHGWNHPFTYPSAFSVGAKDSFGNSSGQHAAEYGQKWQVKLAPSGHELAMEGTSAAPESVEIANSLEKGAINACIYKAGRLLAQSTHVVPGQKAVFSFKPSMFIGVVSQIDEGEVMNSAIVSEINTEISLLGIASADIVMTGGGQGKEATPFQFTLQNIVYA